MKRGGFFIFQGAKILDSIAPYKVKPSRFTAGGLLLTFSFSNFILTFSVSRSVF